MNEEPECFVQHVAATLLSDSINAQSSATTLQILSSLANTLNSVPSSSSPLNCQPPVANNATANASVAWTSFPAGSTSDQARDFLRTQFLQTIDTLTSGSSQ